MLALVLGCLLPQSADAGGRVSEDLIKARQLFFGVENVNARSGAVDKDKVIFSWATNSTLAVSVKGRIVLLDSYVHRLEKQPGRTPFVLSDLVNLEPEAIFLGHGHNDHAANAAYLSATLSIPIYPSAETCDAMQVDAARLLTAGKITVSSVECHAVTSAGSLPGAEVVKLSQLEPVACITAFKHLHSTTVPTDTSFPIIPVLNIADPRDPQLFPPGTPEDPIFNTSGGAGGPISLFFQFVTHGDNHFAFVWHNTTGALKEGCGLDQCYGPEVGQRLVDIMGALPPTDIEFGSMVSLGYPTNGMRDVVLYNQAIEPKVYVPVHQTNAALPSSSLEFKVSYLKQLDAMNVPLDQRPEPRWMVDPNDYLKPMVYDPEDKRWSKDRRSARHGGGSKQHGAADSFCR